MGGRRRGASRATYAREVTEQRSATRYTARWHRFDAWASRGLPGEIANRDPRGAPRISIRRGSWVDDLLDDEEAEAKAVDLAILEFRREGPRGDFAGRRRVLIRCHTWLVDEQAGVLYDPQWITTGEGMTGRSAVAAHNRYVRAYASSVLHGIESRLLRATAMEVVWWTASQHTNFV